MEVKNIENIEFNNDELFINLKLLSKLKPYDKLKIDISKTKLLSVDNDYLQSITRFINGYDRNNTLEFIDKLINTVIIKTTNLKNYSIKQNNIKQNNIKQNKDDICIEIDLDNKELISIDPSIELLKFTNELNNVNDGLINLKITYTGDQLVQSKLDYIIEKIRTHINDLNHYISKI